MQIQNQHSAFLKIHSVYSQVLTDDNGLKSDSCVDNERAVDSSLQHLSSDISWLVEVVAVQEANDSCCRAFDRTAKVVCGELRGRLAVEADCSSLTDRCKDCECC